MHMEWLRTNLLINVGCDSNARNVVNDVVGETPKHIELDPIYGTVALYSLGDEIELCDSPLDVGKDMDSCIDQINVEHTNMGEHYCFDFFKAYDLCRETAETLDGFCKTQGVESFP